MSRVKERDKERVLNGRELREIEREEQ